MKLPLELLDVRPWKNDQFKLYTESEPFVLNERGLLVHRPRTVTLIRLNGCTAVDYWCRGHAVGQKKFTFLESPPEDKLVCEICERRATMAGLPSSTDLAGRHVCVGRVKAFNTCHLHKEDE